MVKFVHLADVHLGGWRERKLSEMNFKAFERAFEVAISNKVDFVLISGDLFDMPLPRMDIIERAAKVLMNAKKASISVYAIGGSHDFSLSRDSLLNTFDTVEILELVDKRPFLKDGFLITGVSGKMNSLDRFDFDRLDLPIFKTGVFLFHINVCEVTSVNYDGISLDMLPRGFRYYAGGHIHKKIVYPYCGGYVVYPGPLFPNNFKELKEGNGGFYLVEMTENDIKFKYFDNELRKKVIVKDCTGKLPSEVRMELMDCVESDMDIVLLELFGEVDWRVSEVGLSEVVDKFYENGCDVVLRNTRGLRRRDVEMMENIEKGDVDKFVCDEIKRLSIYESEAVDSLLIDRLLKENFEREEDEKNSEYEERVIKILERIFEDGA